VGEVAVKREDAELVLAARAGDRQAFAELVRRYRDAVYAVAYHRVGDFAAAEDLTQDALVQAYVRLGELRDPARFGPWLFAVTRNLCNQYLRARREGTGEVVADAPTDGVERQAVARDLVHRALSTLPPDNALALTLFYVDGYSYREIAGFLGVPVSTVKGRIERGRRQLRDEVIIMLKDHFKEHPPPEDLPEMVIRRISAAEVWAMPPDAQREQLAGILSIDGHLAELRFRADAGSTVLVAEVPIHTVGDRPLCVLQLVGKPNRYYVFGKAKVLPDGPKVENQLIEVSAKVTLVAGALAAEPWQPEKVSSAAVWAMRGQERERWFTDLLRRAGGPIMLDGGLAFSVLVAGGRGCAAWTPGGEVSFWHRGRNTLTVYRRVWPSVHYYVFGSAEVIPPGLRVKDCIVFLEAVEVGPIVRLITEGGTPPQIPSFSSHDLWRLDPEAQAEILCRAGTIVLIDGELCRVRLAGLDSTTLVASTPIATVGDLSCAIYRFFATPNRYCIFGEAQLPEAGMQVANQAVEVEVAVAQVPREQVGPTPTRLPQLSAAEICRLSPAEREGFFNGLKGQSHVFLDGGLARFVLLGGSAGCSCTTPGEEVQFRNVGEENLYIYRWVWPTPRYFVFGEAEVTPPGLRVRDAIVALQARVGQA